MSHQLQLTYQVTVLFHDGYCSGGDCELQQSISNKYITIPDNLVDKYFPYEIHESYHFRSKVMESGSNYCERTEIPEKYTEYECNTKHYELKKAMIVEKEKM